ncbi:MAG: hypothetical protein WAN87_05590 [Thermoplasmata archaeon]
MNPRERELMTGMGNCYAACGANYEETIGMVAETRKLTPEQVKGMLAEIRAKYGNDVDYQALRNRLPATFPF